MDDNHVKEKSELVVDAIQYAHDHNLDINKKEDVISILDALNPNHTENIDEFAELLKNADAFMEMTAKDKEPKKENLPN